MNHNPWFRGAKYKIRYRLPGQRYDREAVLVYLGKPVTTSRKRRREFSGRPDYGTLTLEADWILGNERVDEDAELYMDRRAPTEA
jgi:hypothetical protein